MLGKELLSGLWVCPECRSFCCHFHTRPCLTLLFHRSLFSHHFRCDPALSVFASKCQGECHAWTAALCDLGDPGWGDPWFLHWALLILTPSDLAPGVFVVFPCFASCLGHFRHDTQDVILHESLLLVAIPFPGVFFWLVCFCLVCCCFCVLFCVFGFLAGIAYWTAYRSITSTFVAIDKWQPCTIRWTEKKIVDTGALQRYFQVSPKLLKVSCCGVVSWALRNLAVSVSMISICFKVV